MSPLLLAAGMALLGTVPTQASAATAAPVVVPQAASASALKFARWGRIRYTITTGERGMLVGRATSEWQHDGAIYKIENVSETAGLVALFKSAKVVQRSEGQVTSAGLLPNEFRIDRNGSVESSHFDWQAGRVSFSNGNRCNLPSIAGLQDALSMFFQFGQMGVLGSNTDVSVATGRKCERYAFARLGEEKLALKFGEQRTVHLRSSTAGSSEAIELWLGLDMGGFPLKIRHVDRKGEAFDQVAEQVDLELTGKH